MIRRFLRLPLSIALLASLGPAALAARPPKRKKVRDAKRGWWARVDRAQASQPHWITPLVTVTPLLAEEFRFDLSRAAAPAGATVSLFNAKGLELIPTEHIEVITAVPAYVVPTAPGTRSGWADFPMLVKYRLFSAPEREGNSVITAMLGATFPTGSNGHGAGVTVLNPAIGFGKGWGAFDVQGTFGGSLPSGSWQRLGSPLLLNAAFQYRVLGKLWPQVEVNTTAWPNGSNEGKKETFLTPGIIFGRFPFHGRVGFVVGGGVQIATTHFHRSNHNVILTIRFPF